MFNIFQPNHWISATNKKFDAFDNNSIVARSPSSNSTLSSHCTSDTSGVAAAATSSAAAAASVKHDELASSTEFQPATFPSINDDWENLLSAPNEEQTFLGWIMSNEQQNVINPSDFEGFSNLLEPSFQEFEIDNSVSFLGDNEKSTFNPVPVQNPLLYNPTRQPDTNYLVPPNPKRLHSAAFPQSNIVQQQRPPPKPKEETVTTIAQQQQVIVDQLFKAAELLEAGNPFTAREILARLNQQLPPSSLGLKPILRSAFIFKDVLTSIATGSRLNPNPLSNPWDVVFKLSSYKAFSEVSPLIHFTDFTCTQTLLEEIGSDDSIHIVDFDIKIGGQWSSFMQELAHRRSNNGTIPFLKLTAVVSVPGFHPLELQLTRENLSQFAQELSIPFEFNFITIESFDPNEFLTANESIAVNLPIGSHYVHTLATIIRLVKQMNPKIVLSVDQGCDRSDLPFSHYFLHTFQSCMVLLDSIDAAGTNADVASKIEKFLVHPRVESSIVGRHRVVEKVPPWRAMYASAGFVQCQFSNFTETQAECLLKRVQVRGFHVEKRQGSMFLYWQRGELGSVSAWKC